MFSEAVMITATSVLTDDMQVFFQVEKRDATGVETLSSQLELQLLLQGRVCTRSVDSHHKAILHHTLHTLLLTIP